MSKVKGQSTPEDIAEGRSTVLLKEGNDMSDHYASRGIQSHNPTAIHYSQTCGVGEKLRIRLQDDINLFMLEMLEANRQVVAGENRISKSVGGTSTEIAYDTDGPTKQVARVTRQLGYCNTENLSTFDVASPHLSMLGSFKQPLVHMISLLQL